MWRTYSAGVMVLSYKYVNNVAHESDKVKEVSQRLFREFMEKMNSIQYGYLKKAYRKGDIGCSNIIIKTAEISDKLMIE